MEIPDENIDVIRRPYTYPYRGPLVGRPWIRVQFTFLQWWIQPPESGWGASPIFLIGASEVRSVTVVTHDWGGAQRRVGSSSMGPGAQPGKFLEKQSSSDFCWKYWNLLCFLIAIFMAIFIWIFYSFWKIVHPSTPQNDLFREWELPPPPGGSITAFLTFFINLVGTKIYSPSKITRSGLNCVLWQVRGDQDVDFL